MEGELEDKVAAAELRMVGAGTVAVTEAAPKAELGELEDQAVVESAASFAAAAAVEKEDEEDEERRAPVTRSTWRSARNATKACRGTSGNKDGAFKAVRMETPSH